MERTETEIISQLCPATLPPKKMKKKGKTFYLHSNPFKIITRVSKIQIEYGQTEDSNSCFTLKICSVLIRISLLSATKRSQYLYMITLKFTGYTGIFIVFQIIQGSLCIFISHHIHMQYILQPLFHKRGSKVCQLATAV